MLGTTSTCHTADQQKARLPQSPGHLCPTYEEAGAALDRLIEIARGDTGGSARAADFLLAWWNGPELGHFPIMHLTGLDRALGRDAVTIMAFLVEHYTCYADAWERRAEMERLIDDWRFPAQK